MSDGTNWPGDNAEIRLTLLGRPYTKKNSQRIVQNRRTGARFVKPSENFEAYEKACLVQIPHCMRLFIDEPVNVQCVYYMPTRHRVDLVNLLEATDDILVSACLLADDNAGIIAGHDGSRVRYDKNRPRVEITITRVKEERVQSAQEARRADKPMSWSVIYKTAKNGVQKAREKKDDERKAGGTVAGEDEPARHPVEVGNDV